MKNRGFKKILLALVVLGITLAFSLSVGADEGEIGEMPDEYGDFLDSLPENLSELLPDGIYSSDGERVSEGVMGAVSPKFLLEAVLDAFGSKLTDLLPSLCLLCGIVILSASLYAVSGFFSAGLQKAVDLCARLCAYCAISGASIASLSRLNDFFESLFEAVAAFVPLSGVLYAMGGNYTAASSGSALISTILVICQFVCTKTVIPVFCICLALSLLSAFDCTTDAAGQSVAGKVKKWYNTALGFVMMILTAALASQSILSAKADSVAMRGVKFAVSGFVPITGGTVSSTLGTLAASVELIRGAVGIVGMISLLLMLIPVIVELAVMRLIFDVAAFTAGMLGCSGEHKLLNEIGGLYGYLEGIAALSSAIFIIAMAIFAMTASAVG